MIGILIGLLAFFIPYAFKAKPLAENEQRVRIILWWKFRTMPRWRSCIIILLLIIYRGGVFAPYLLYSQDQRCIKECQSQIETNRLALALYKEQVRLNVLNNWKDWAHCGAQSFLNGDYATSSAFFELAFNDPDARYGIAGSPQWAEKVEDCPYYYYDLLKVNETNHAEAVNKFHADLDEMTNTMHHANFEKLPNAYNSSNQLSFNIKRLEIIKSLLPVDEQNYVQSIIDAVHSISTNGNVNP